MYFCVCIIFLYLTLVLNRRDSVTTHFYCMKKSIVNILYLSISLVFHRKRKVVQLDYFWLNYPFKFTLTFIFLADMFSLKWLSENCFHSISSFYKWPWAGMHGWKQVESDKCDTFSSLQWTSSYRFICFRSTLISFIYFFLFKSIPRHSSVVPPPAPQDYCGSNDTSRSSITGTIEWFKPFLVLGRASGELNVAYSADPIPVGVIASVTAFWRAGSNVLRTDFFWKVASACQILFLFFIQCFIGLVLSFSFLASS